MIYIQRVRSNDIGEDYGKQVELGKVFMSHHKWETGEIPVVITFRALSESQMSLNGTKIKTSFKVRGDERGGDRIGVDCKEYANQDRICVLKQFLTEKLHLNPEQDYFILEDVGSDGRSFNLYGVHSSEIPATVLLDKFKGKVVDMDEPYKTEIHKFDDASDNLKSLVRAIRTKPFVLLAGISGTGKSRIVRKLAQACWEPGSDEAKAHKPSNFEMVQVKPNWHDSSELLGYVSRIGDKPQFIAGDFLKFIAKAWENPDVPYFLCLDEMNLAPVEQYFAEYLSVVESRKLQDDNITILSDPILKPESGNSESGKWYQDLCNSLSENGTIQHKFLNEGIGIPQNLIVVGTVNMDETTYSFSRKVLDRAMTIEMNEVDLRGGLHKSEDLLPHIEPKQILADAVEGFDVYEQNQESCDKVIVYLDAINKILDKTPFKVAYRTRNEFLIYVVNALKLAVEDADVNVTIANALDEVTSMKILSRIEGDKRKVGFLSDLKNVIKTELAEIDGVERSKDNSISLSKLFTMEERLKSGYTSFWD